jgi:hypothetical protein
VTIIATFIAIHLVANFLAVERLACLSDHRCNQTNHLQTSFAIEIAHLQASL